MKLDPIKPLRKDPMHFLKVVVQTPSEDRVVDRSDGRWRGKLDSGVFLAVGHYGTPNASSTR